MRKIIKAALQTGTGSVLSILFRIITTKILAIVIGPSGVGLYSILKQTIQTTAVLGTVGGNTALVQGVASKSGDDRIKYIATVKTIFLTASILVSTIIFLLAKPAAFYLFNEHGAEHINTIRILACAVLFQSWAVFAGGLLNGLGEIGRLALQKVAESIVIALLAWPIAIMVSLGYWSLLAVLQLASGIVSFTYGIWALKKSGHLYYVMIKPSFNKAAVKHFRSIAGTTVLVGLMTTGTILALRVLIIKTFGLEGAGYFELAWTLSMTYVMLILSSLGTYYMPQLSTMNDQVERQKFMRDVFRFVLLSMPIVVTMMIVGKPMVVELLYSSEFSDSLYIIRWMLIGDFVKGVSWVLAMPMLSYGHMNVFFVYEVSWNIMFFILASVSILVFNSMEGVGIAFAVMYVIYFIFVLFFYCKRVINFTLGRKLSAQLMFFFALIVGVSWMTWNDDSVILGKMFAGITVAVASSWFMITKSEKQYMFSKIHEKIVKRLF